jgi:hypothetical protein
MRDDFTDGTTKIRKAYQDQGFDVRVDIDSPQFMRLWVADPTTGLASKVELAADLRYTRPSPWRSDPSPISTTSPEEKSKPCSPAPRHVTSSTSTP